MKNGSSATSYEPYTGGKASPNPDYPQDIHVVTGDNTVVVNGKNLAGPIQGELNYGGTNIKASKTGITVSGTLTSDSTFSFLNTVVRMGQYWQGQTLSTANAIKLLPGTYTFKYHSDTGHTLLAKYGNLGQRLDASTTVGNYDTFTITEDKYLCLYFYKSATNTQFNVAFDSIQLERNSTATTFVPHVAEQTQLLSLGSIELAKIGTYQDRIYKSGGKWYVEKNVEKFNVTNITLESWGFQLKTNAQNIVAPASTNSLPILMCNYFQNITANNAYGLIGNVQQGIALTGANNSNLLVRDTAISTLEEFSPIANNLKVYGAHSTPTTTEITDTTLIGQLEQLLTKTTYKNTTNMWSIVASGNAEGELEVEYRQDLNTLKNELQSLEARVTLLET